MLDGITKNRIDTLRQILVGKLPDPKAQVEQITNGLIYKFMNDMDEESISMGGKSTYFSGKYQKYSWKNLLDTKTSGVEKLSLYSEAIEQMYNNENLPELFREIFKNSFLPFKDPSTLNMFLKEINEFRYSNSEKLGDAFEYLLSLMGSQGDAGQFRTPRHIIDFIVEIVNPQKNETILDPACGTAGFLISSYKHILKQNTKKNLGDGLTASDRKKIGENLNGYDISPDMVKMSLVNMYLHKFTNPKINEYDTLSSEDRWNEYYDVILANPPFFSPKGGIMPHNRFGVKSTKAEVLFVDYINEHLKPNGRAGIIVPDGIVSQTGDAYKKLRRDLIKTSLVAVISLPHRVFMPYSGVKTAILILDKKKSINNKEIIFSTVNNDGFSLSTQRNKINKNDIPKILSEIKEKKNNTDSTKLILKENLLKNSNYSLNLSHYSKTNKSKNLNYVKLNDKKYFDIFSGGTPKSNVKEYWGGKVNWITLVDLPPDEFITEIKESTRKITELGLSKSSAKILPVNSIIVSTRATIGRVATNKVPVATNQGFKNIIIKDNKLVLYKFVAFMVKSLKNEMNDLATGSTFKELSKTAFGNLEIPLPPISVQKEIVNDLEINQKNIKEFKDKIKNYEIRIQEKIKKVWED
jgi:type I restriction enzyme M protein